MEASERSQPKQWITDVYASANEEKATIVASLCGGPLDEVGAFVGTTDPIQMKGGEYRWTEWGSDGDAVFEWFPADSPEQPEGEARARIENLPTFDVTTEQHGHGYTASWIGAMEEVDAAHGYPGEYLRRDDVLAALATPDQQTDTGSSSRGEVAP